MGKGKRKGKGSSKTGEYKHFRRYVNAKKELAAKKERPRLTVVPVEQHVVPLEPGPAVQASRFPCPTARTI